MSFGAGHGEAVPLNATNPCIGPAYNFDTPLDWSGLNPVRWSQFATKDILPFWIADMEFRTPAPVIDAIRNRLAQPQLGYQRPPASATRAVVDWAAREYGWTIKPEWVVWTCNAIAGVNLACEAVSGPGAAAMVHTPGYGPLRDAPDLAGMATISVAMTPDDAGIWRLNFDAMRRSITPTARILVLCNPHNPTGRVFSRDELREIIGFCRTHDLLLCSDEVHCPIVLDASVRHIPVASIDETFADRTITVVSMTKAFNTQGAGAAVAIIPDPQLRQEYDALRFRKHLGAGALEFVAAEASFADSSGWCAQLVRYLRGNLDALQAFVDATPGLVMTRPEGTYLAWIDIRALALNEPPEEFFAAHGIGLAGGLHFGLDGFARLTFACPRAMLREGLRRFGQAVKAAGMRPDVPHQPAT